MLSALLSIGLTLAERASFVRSLILASMGVYSDGLADKSGKGSTGRRPQEVDVIAHQIIRSFGHSMRKPSGVTLPASTDVCRCHWVRREV